MFSRILLASRPDVDGESAALPALAVALKSRARLRVLEFESRRTFSVRQVLSRWKLMPDDCRASEVSELGLAIKKRPASGPYCVASLAEEAREKECDLVVLASPSPRSWLSRLQSRLLGDGPGFGCHCLVAPASVSGFVDPDTGAIQIGRILCCGPGTREVASSLGQLLGLPEPLIEECGREDCWARAREPLADLVVLAAGHELNAASLEELVAQAPCPVLVVPPEGSEGHS